MAPLLALLAWFAIDFFTGETPHAAVQGQSYALVEKPNCRYDSGLCGLKNNDFELELSYRRISGDRLTLDLTSVFPLDGVLLAVVISETDDKNPVPMKPAAPGGLKWSLDVRIAEPESDRIRLVASAQGTVYYGDASTQFILADRDDS